MQSSRDELLRAYRSMVTIRRFEERVQEEFSKGGIPGFVHLYAGEEASAVGMCQHLGPKDYIASTHRGHGHSIAKGCDVVGMMHELFGKEGGLCGGKGGSMHIADLDQGMLGANGIVGGGPPLVVGAALTAKTLGTGTVAVCFSGDGASNQGTTFEALNMAVVLQLPAVFVFENNQYGEGTGFSYAVGSRDIAGRAGGFGLPAVKVTGDDFFAVHEAAREAVERARSGGGPSAIEVDTCRFYGHHSGDAQLYRGKDEVKRLRDERDCIANFRRRVDEVKLLEIDALDAIDAEVAALIDRAVEEARTAAPPPESALLTDVYVSY
ncbi:MAG TPA: thiamine pyrophosphate-dependent dehydrogenase E1 component subunit alpha [Stellaceae bacterium]|jgi:pyruvate dehydrogenase E1 component alpha subunit|nr:thiamine pyrophosphate-dependent dehydrogenase E1 component subunit alpha [Stellaceae bacterium]